MYVCKNLNPKGKKTGDCAIRAVAAATNKSWDETYIGLANIGFKNKTIINDTETVDLYLRQLGFNVGTIKVNKGGHRPTVKSFANEHPNWVCVLRVANHLVACAYGNYIDIWDSGDKSVYKYWYKPL